MAILHESVARGIFCVGAHCLVARGKGESFSHLPGGHVEAGENPANALVREIREELGRDISDMQYLGQLENTYDRGGDTIYEVNHLFRARLYPPMREEALPQAKEDHLSFRWVPIQDLEAERLMPPAIIPYVVGVGGM